MYVLFVKIWIATRESFIAHPPLIQLTKEEAQMKPSDIISTKTIVFGTDAADMSDDQVFDSIRRVEMEIKNLILVDNKPQKLIDRIAEMRLQVAQLVKYVDAR